MPTDELDPRVPNLLSTPPPGHPPITCRPATSALAGYTPKLSLTVPLPPNKQNLLRRRPRHHSQLVATAVDTMSHSTPSIRIHDPYIPSPQQCNRPTHPLPPSIPIPMAAKQDVPPPLPPPRYISGLAAGQDLGWRWSNSRRDVDLDTPYPPSAKSGSSMTSVLPARHRYSRDDGVPFDSVDSRWNGQMSSTPVEADMQSNEGLDPSDEERNGITRPSLARYEHALRWG